MKMSKKARMIIHVLLIVFGLIWIYPFIWMITSSLKTNTEFLAGGINPLPENPQWGNYLEAWVHGNFGAYFLNTIIFTLAVVAIVIILSSLTGYVLGRIRFPGKMIVMTVAAVVMFLPHGYTIIPLFQLVNQLGLMDSLLGIIVAESAGAHVLFILMFAAFFARIPKELEDAAEIDGAGFLRIYARIMFPLSMPIVATTAIMQFIWTWSSFLIPLVFTVNQPGLRTLAVGMQNFVGTYYGDYAGMAAGATITLLPVLVIFILMQRYFIDGIAGSVKS